MGSLIHSLPRSELGKLQNSHRVYPDPARPRVPAPPLTLEHLLGFEEALQRFKGLDSIFLGDLNVDPDKSWSLQSQRIADLLTEFGLIDLVRHF